MLGRQLQRRRAVDGVHARGEDRDLVARRTGNAVQFEVDHRAFAAANPVALHGANFFRPALQLVQVAQQFVGVVGDAQEPLLQLALLHDRVFVPPAASARQHLLVGQHGGALRAPVHLALLAIGQAALVELQEEPLVPAVVLRQAGGDFLRPVVGEAQALHLRASCWSMLRSVHSRGGVWLAMAAFSAGRPKESQPMGCSTLYPCIHM